MSVSVTAVKNGPEGAYEYLLVQLAFSGLYPTGGEPVDLTAILDKAGLAPVGQPSQLPILVDPKVENMAGYYAQWIVGSALSNGKLQVFQPGGSEYSAGAYGAPFTSTPAAKVFLRIELQNSDR